MSDNCDNLGPKQSKLSGDPHAKKCDPLAQFEACDGLENLHNAPNAPFLGLDGDIFNKKTNLGEPNYADPMLAGKIFDDDKTLPPDRDVIYRYSKGFRSIDEAVKKLFMNIEVADNDGTVFPVPIIWGTQEKAVTAILQKNVRKDNTGVVDRITLPMLSIYTSDYGFPRERFVHHMAIDYKRGMRMKDKNGSSIGSIGGAPGITHREKWGKDTILGISRGIPVDLGYNLTIWTAFYEDMNQILEQIATKFNPLAYIHLQGVTNWESTVRIDSVSNNLDLEPGENKRVFKFQIHLTAESYIPQPIHRRKSVLKTKIDVFNGIDTSDVERLISSIESVTGELET